MKCFSFAQCYQLTLCSCAVSQMPIFALTSGNANYKRLWNIVGPSLQLCRDFINTRMTSVLVLLGGLCSDSEEA
jgi:hypothetical protein